MLVVSSECNCYQKRSIDKVLINSVNIVFDKFQILVPLQSLPKNYVFALNIWKNYCCCDL